MMMRWWVDDEDDEAGLIVALVDVCQGADGQALDVVKN